MGVGVRVRRLCPGDFGRFGVAACNVGAGRRVGVPVYSRGGVSGSAVVVRPRSVRPRSVRSVVGPVRLVKSRVRVVEPRSREPVRVVESKGVVESKSKSKPRVESKGVVESRSRVRSGVGAVVERRRRLLGGGGVVRGGVVRGGGRVRGGGGGVTCAARVRECLLGRGRGRFLVVVACGPSVGEVDFSGVGGCGLVDVMCVNKPFLPLWPCEFWMFCDNSQYRRNVEAFDGFGGVVLNSTNVRVRRGNQFVFRARAGRGFCLDVAEGFHIGRSSTYAAMQVIAYMGYERVFLFGVDMCAVGGRLHHYGRNPDVSDENRRRRFAAEAESYDWAGRNLCESLRRRFFFCSSYNPWPFTGFFNRWDHRDAVPRILDLVGGLG